MNVEKHESSLLTVVSDVGSTPTASTNSKLLILKPPSRVAFTLCQKRVSRVSLEHSKSKTQ